MEGRGTRRSNSFLGVVSGFPGLSRTSFKGPGEDSEEEEEESDGTEGVPAPVGASQASSFESKRQPAFKTPSMKAPECFDGTRPFKKVLYATSFLNFWASKWIEPYLSNITNQDPTYLLNSWQLFESQLFTLFGDPNEVRKAEAELDALRMKEGGNSSLYISNFIVLVSSIGDWVKRALIHHFRKGFPSRILDQMASHPSRLNR
ncbi:hypothetical protein O181_062890 [Austropuccinia psidii MF-1]|uniref:Retrotransposon gag domain-containing protein n=1 Tax=Austropuccinia psidii MF-1 TaxID=1389203 RepID=A0A9Q3EQ72_9BASI|nr:hypothetical protein [Austropuccinia psidii MF-1]